MTPHRLNWCIYGSGRAGQARLRHAPPDIDATLFSAREHALSDILSTKPFDGVVICTENQRHAADIRVALTHLCHVIVEFPLCLTEAEASELYSLAEAQSRMLHCAHIGLLKPDIQWLLNTQPQLGHIQVHFQGGLYRWLDQAYRSKSVAVLTIGRLQVLWALCGPLSLTTVVYQDLGNGYRLSLQFKSPMIERVLLTERRQPQLKRQSEWQFLSATHHPIEQPTFEPQNLFYTDWTRALSHIAGQECYLSPKEVLAVLALCDQIQAQI